ncbi:hypothetical protein [Deinococcus radiotolerans]|uniref:Uncharacterized protein n=1 Tax=Deinococcus radiotolerans TaxID=1309407 RepID=A0ABQ2FNF6_9DEIO|nr:hypothetical protein [Deinococcus radiotolerans]GGL11213.1 hypothetical protein GCM10010844_32340 [Deinococcus radiotolerans]
MTTIAPQTTSTTAALSAAANKPHGVAVSRRYGEADAAGHRKSANTNIGGAWSFKDGKVGMNVRLSAIPMLGVDSSLMIFAGGKGETFTITEPRLVAFQVVEFTTRDSEKKKRWTIIGSAFRSKNGGAYRLAVDAIPTDLNIVLLPPKDKNATEVVGTSVDTPVDAVAPF